MKTKSNGNKANRKTRQTEVASTMNTKQDANLYFQSVRRPARNQLGTPGGAKSLLRGAQIF